MLFDRKGKENADPAAEKAVVGYDFGSEYAQISYWLPGVSKPETVSWVAGGEDYLIPALLGRNAARDFWLFGKEAQKAVASKEALAVDRILERAAAGEAILLGEEGFDPVILLSLFIRRSLSLLTPILPPDKVQCFVFSVEKVTRPVVDALMRAAALLEIPADSCYVVGRAESFYYYNINQPQELWRSQVLVCHLDQRGLETYRFHLNKRTRPMAAVVEELFFEDIKAPVLTNDAVDDKRAGMLLDKQFCQVLPRIFGKNDISTVYLIGTGFEGEWYRESLPVLCRERRVFLGNNLYSKGACYAAKARLMPRTASTDYVFLGQDMIKSNMGIFVTRRGTDAYLALLDAGTNWYDAKRECDFLLEEGDGFSLRITPVDGRMTKDVQVTLAGLPKRSARTTRIHLCVEMTDTETVRISMEDLGFGEFYPATHRLWEESFVL